MMEKPPAADMGEEEKKGKRILHFSYLSTEHIPISPLVAVHQLSRQPQIMDGNSETALLLAIAFMVWF